jgi:hypothetical protein
MSLMNYFFFICSVVLIAISIWMIRRRLNVLHSGERSQGSVVDHEKRQSDDGTTYRPVFKFVDHNGVEHVITSNSGWSAPHPPLGTKVRVRYHRQNPVNAYIESFYHLWFWPLVLMGVAVVLLLAIWLPGSCLNSPRSQGCNSPSDQF